MDEPTGFDPKRRLCPDGTCTGIIGGDGRCGVCGRLPSGKDHGTAAGARDGASDDSTDGADTAASEDALPDSGSGQTASVAGHESGFNPARRLCGDGACVGVVGASGVCPVCQRVAD